MANGKDMVAIIDFGSQYTQLITRRIRELKVYSEIFPYNTKAKILKEKGAKAVILSGGPGHIPEKGIIPFDREILNGDFYILGICYGMQLIGKIFGGNVSSGEKREYGKTKFYPDRKEKIFQNLKNETTVWMSHWDYVEKLPEGFKIIGNTDTCRIAAMRNNDRKIYCLQFHPEVIHTVEGKKILKNFLFQICGFKPSWNPSSMLVMAENEIRNKVKDNRIICALSGGVDSSCLAVLLNKVCGNNSLSIFVDNGLLRKGETERIHKISEGRLNLKQVDATELFLKQLKGISAPEKKRKIIGNTFIRIFEKEAKKFGAKFLAQGTLYPDVIESTSPFGGPSAKIKTHHNVGGLPETLHLSLVEPFRFLFKDEVRKIGRQLGLSEEIVSRHPFPGPGLAVRIIGSVTKEKISILKEADYIVEEEIRKAGLYKKLWQAFAILLPIKSVGIMGDKRTYENVVVLRIVRSTDGMTADWAKIPYSVLEKISNRLVNEVKGLNRVVYDITSKPPATIEWE